MHAITTRPKHIFNVVQWEGESLERARERKQLGSVCAVCMCERVRRSGGLPTSSSGHRVMWTGWKNALSLICL